MKDIEGFVMMMVVICILISFTIGMVVGTKSGRRLGHMDAVKAGHAQYIPGENGEATFEWLNPCNK